MSPPLAATSMVLLSAVLPVLTAWFGTWRPSHARRLLSRGALLVDVGTRAEYAKRHASGAINIPADDLALRQIELGELAQPIVLYARGHLRCALAVQTLKGVGFHEVFGSGTLAELTAWGFPVAARPLSGGAHRTYSR